MNRKLGAQSRRAALRQNGGVSFGKAGELDFLKGENYEIEEVAVDADNEATDLLKVHHPVVGV